MGRFPIAALFSGQKGRQWRSDGQYLEKEPRQPEATTRAHSAGQGYERHSNGGAIQAACQHIHEGGPWDHEHLQQWVDNHHVHIQYRLDACSMLVRCVPSPVQYGQRIRIQRLRQSLSSL